MSMHIPDPREREIARRYFRPFLEHFRSCRSVVDVASGQGHCLELLAEAGIPATGIELDAALCEASRRKGLNVVEGDFFAVLAATPPGSYDGAQASHIVEHFTPERVAELLRLLHGALSPGAPLVILTPNIANLRRAVGDFWRDPTHVRPYPISALDKLLRRAGFTVVASGEYTDRAPSLTRRLVYAVRNALLGRYWSGDDLFVVARRTD
jgi:O-antigen chain-terminating methyltransferase